MQYVALLRGVNVGGKNKVSMLDLKLCFEALGFTQVVTLLNSGNVCFAAHEPKRELAQKIETALIKTFTFDSKLIKVLVLSHKEITAVIKHAPQDFGTAPDTYYSDVVFVIGKPVSEVFAQTECNPEVDKAWQGEGVIYYQRRGEGRTRSRLTKIIAKPIYKSITIRTFNTVKKLDRLMSENYS